MNWSVVWGIAGRRGYPQNISVLVVLVIPYLVIYVKLCMIL